MKQLIPALFVVGAVMLLIGAAVYVTGWQLSPYIYTVGATFVALAQINSANIWCIVVGAYRSFYVFYAW